MAKNINNPSVQFELVSNLIRSSQGKIFGKFKIAQSGQCIELNLELLKVVSLGYVAQLLIPEHEFNQKTLLNKNFATAREHIKCIFRFGSKMYKWTGLLPVDYPIVAELIITKDYECKRDIHSIVLKTYGEGNTLQHVYHERNLKYCVPHKGIVSIFSKPRKILDPNPPFSWETSLKRAS